MTRTEAIAMVKRRVGGLSTHLPLVLQLNMEQIEEHWLHNENLQQFERWVRLLEQITNELDLLYLAKRLHPASALAARMASVASRVAGPGVPAKPAEPGGNHDDAPA